MAKRMEIFSLYFPDVWGLFKNGNLVVDSFADAGYMVFGLDYFQGVRLATCIANMTDLAL